MDDKGKFVRIICAKCGNRQVVFGKASTNVKCLKCNRLLGKTSGGKVRIRAVIRRVFNVKRG